jgi:flagellar motor switch protein FliN/FliY
VVADPTLLWVSAASSGSLIGSFAFGMSPDSALLLSQVLTMTKLPAINYGEEEREATSELLRQVCGLCATELTVSQTPPTLSVGNEGTLSWTASEQRCFQVTDGLRTATITIAIDPVLLVSLTAAPIQSQVPSVPRSDTDRGALQRALNSRNLDLLMDVNLGVRLRFGSRRMKLREILELHPGTVVELDRQVQEPVELLVDNKLIARGEVVVIDGNYGLKIHDVLSPQQCVAALY